MEATINTSTDQAPPAEHCEGVPTIDEPVTAPTDPVQEEPIAPLATPKKRQRVGKHTDILKAEFEDVLVRQGDVFVAPLKKPMHILTPTVTLSGDLYDAEGDLEDYVTLKLKRSHADIFAGLEDLLLATAKKFKNGWFNNPDLLDEFLEHSLRRFFDKENRLLTVRLDEGLGGKKEVPKGTKVKVVLQSDGATFTRTQYGFLWKMTMIKSIEKSEDQYLFDPEEDPTADGLATGDLLGCVGQDEPVDEFLT